MVSVGAWMGSNSDAPFLSWPDGLTRDRVEELFRRLVLRMLVKHGAVVKGLPAKNTRTAFGSSVRCLISGPE